MAHSAAPSATTVPGFAGFGGVSSETACLAKLLVHAGLHADEAAVLAAGGGIGFAYNLYPGPWGVHVAVGFLQPGGAGEFSRRAMERLGVEVRLTEESNAVFAERALVSELGKGRPAMLWGAKAELPWFPVRPELAPLVEHRWVVWGRESEDGDFLVSDLAAGPLRLDPERLAGARSALFAAKHRQLTVHSVAEVPDPVRLDRAAARASARVLRDPLLPGQGLAGIERWAGLLVDREARRGWPRLMHPERPGKALYDALVAVYDAVELAAPGGLRELWALHLERLGASEAAGHYREVADGWRTVGRTALADGERLLRRTRETLRRRDRRFRAGAGRDELAHLDGELATLRGEASEGWTVAGPAILDGLREALLEVHRRETAAATVLAAWAEER